MTRKKPIHMNIPRIFISLLYLHLLFIDLHYYLFMKHIIYIINLIFFTDLFQCMNTFSETIPSKNSLLRKRKCTQKQLQILTENAHIISLEVLQPRIFDHNTNSFGIRKTFDDRKNIQGGGIVSLPSAIKWIIRGALSARRTYTRTYHQKFICTIPPPNRRPFLHPMNNFQWIDGPAISRQYYFRSEPNDKEYKQPTPTASVTAQQTDLVQTRVHPHSHIPITHQSE